MNVDNPYQAPKSEIEIKEKKEYCKLSLFSIDERLGRLRFIMHFNVLFIFLMLNLLSISISIIVSLVLLPITFILVVIFTCSVIKRFHDFNIGILKVVLFIAFIMILSFIFISEPKIVYLFLSIFIVMALFVVTGTAGKNKFDFPPPPNTVSVYLFSLIPLLIFFLLAQ